jgi:PAS domain S-box-containing protein
MRTSSSKTERELRLELERVHARLLELEATTAAIRSGDVDAIVVEGPNGSQVYNLQSPEDPYSTLVERMNEGAATLSADGTILFCNRRLAEMAKIPSEQLLGSSFSSLLREERRSILQQMLQSTVRGDVRSEGELLRKDGTVLPVQWSLSLVVFSGLEKVFCLVATDLSELKRAKRGLREQSEIFELAQDAILVRDLDSRIRSWNRGATDLYGWTAEETVGKVTYELFRTGFPEPLETILASLQEKKEWEGELTHTGRDGKVIVVASRWSFLRDEAETPTAILQIDRDITLSKKAGAALQKSEEAYRKLAELGPQLVWKCSPEGLNNYFNQKWVEYTGLTLEQSYGTGWITLFHPEDKEPAQRAWDHAVQTGEDYRIDCRLRAADGSYRWFLIKAVPMHDDQGAIVEWFGTCTDIDNLKRAQEQITTLNQELESRVEERTRELRESEEEVRRKLESILAPEGDLQHFELSDIMDLPAVQSLADMMYKMTAIPFSILDLKGNILVAVGWQRACTEFHRVHPEACRGCKESDQQLSTGVPAGAFKLYQCKNHMRDIASPIVLGDRHIGNVFSGQFFFDDEEIDFEFFRQQARTYGFDEDSYLAAIHEVPRLSREQVQTGMAFYAKLTDLLSRLGYSGIKLSRAMAETKHVNAQLEESVKDLESFAYSVSHDLRAPLRHIDGFLTLLFDHGYSVLDDSAKHYVDRTLEATRRMGNLIDDLLQFSRTGRAEIHKMPADFNALVQEVLKELEPESSMRTVHWKCTPLPTVAVDKALLFQVIENLIGNALKFTRGRETAEIEIGVQPESKGESVFFVRDNGAGFDMRYYNKLFQVFHRLHSEQEFEGTGIGLAIARSIVERHGGRIWAEGSVGEGATFYFSLPANCDQGGKNEFAEAHMAG